MIIENKQSVESVEYIVIRLPIDEARILRLDLSHYQSKLTQQLYELWVRLGMALK